MEDNNRTWIIPKTAKLMALDIAMPKVSTTLPGGLTVTFKKPENIDADAIERYVGIYRTVCYGTHLEPVYNLFRISVAKARTTICRLVLSFRSQFFQSRRHFSSQAKDRSTTHLFGSTTKVCSSLRFTTSTAAPNRLRTPAAKGFPV